MNETMGLHSVMLMILRHAGHLSRYAPFWRYFLDMPCLNYPLKRWLLNLEPRNQKAGRLEDKYHLT